MSLILSGGNVSTIFSTAIAAQEDFSVALWVKGSPTLYSGAESVIFFIVRGYRSTC